MRQSRVTEDPEVHFFNYSQQDEMTRHCNFTENPTCTANCTGKGDQASTKNGI